MPIYEYKPNGKTDRRSLNKAKRDVIVGDILDKFNSWYDQLTEARKDTVALLKEIFPSYKNTAGEVKKIPDVYEQYQTYMSAIYRATYQSYDGMFDIEGQDLRSNDLSSVYKASLVYDFYKINLKGTLDGVLDDWTTKGESAAYVHWDQDIEKVPQIQGEAVLDSEGNIVDVNYKKTMASVVKPGHVDIKRMDPHNLYYDPSQRWNWDMCGKIYRSFVPLQYVLANTAFNLSKEERDELVDMVRNAPQVSDLSDEEKAQDIRVIGSTIEVLEYRGDYLVPETNELLRDMEIFVVAGKYLARMAESMYPVCPWIYGTYLARPDTGRGQSPLKSAYIIADVENKCMDLSLKAWELNVIPTFLAPKGAFAEFTEMVPGKPVEYEQTILGGQSPSKLDFSSGMRNFDFQSFFKNKIEGATGITQYLLGSQDGSVRTASESTYIHAGASMRINHEAYKFSSRIILKIIETFSVFKKYFETEEYDVRVDDDGTQEFKRVDQEVRNGNYTFIIGGNQSAIEKEAEVTKLFTLLGTPAFQSLAQLMDTDTALELLRWVLNRANFKGTNQIFEISGLSQAINQVGQAMGIQPNNIQDFNNDMKQEIRNNLPAIAQNMVIKNMQNGPQPNAMPR